MPRSAAEDAAIDAVLAYHARSKHRLPDHYADALGYLDWETQPNPFRLYEGCERVALARPEALAGPPFDASYTPRAVAARALDVGALSQLLFDALALSAWKEHGASRWSLRCNPSSGNLHPTEAYLVVGAVAGLGDEPGIYHYTPLLHALERRATLGHDAWRALALPDGAFIVALTSIHWREAWKYGERAFRYCQHDVGHAIAALAFAAGVLGWEVRRAPLCDDGALERWLGIADQAGPEAEAADVALVVAPATGAQALERALEVGMPELELPAFAGEANRLSHAHHPWPAIDAVARACRYRAAERAAGAGAFEPEPEPALALALACAPAQRPGPAARGIFRARRSAVAFDGATALAASDLFRMLARTAPRTGDVPFAALAGPSYVHLFVFVHRVTGLAPGLYFLARNPGGQARVRAAAAAELAWERVDTGPLALPFDRLETGDTRRAARVIACGQHIASDGAFAVGMVAELARALDEGGPAAYRRAHWEAGAIGHVLYLEAEAAGVRGTGIGCFFDDALLELVGLDAGPSRSPGVTLPGAQELATLYWFTVGRPEDDPRLRTLDAYHHLAAE